ncbi:hypothetical protein AAFC00_003530 [Neodothiora populina]|uniref:Uncharacterized protein n=1 Tax=Neodothiora populina TaxID=2781224 RepID=A0ABR3PF11_9PEZI
MSPALLHEKVTAITGAVTGIGRAIALEYIRQGAKVAVNYYPDAASEAAFESLVQEVGGDGDDADERRSRLIGFAGDVSKVETGTGFIDAVVRKWGRLDVFVNNAGVCQFAEFLSLPPDLLKSTIDINLTGAFLAIQAAARQMVSQTPQGGSIIGISSISALVGGAGQTHYTPTKAGVSSLIQSCACALGPYGIRCNALLPGTIRTALNEEDLSDEGKLRYMEGRVPLRRLGVPHDLAGPAVFLASDLSGYVTGSQILVDGGAFVNFQ